jgi:hypothetical protein
MSQQQKLEKVLDLLLSEDSDQAAELLHQIIVEKARDIYESIVEEEDKEEEDKEKVEESDEVGGEPNKDFTDEIGSDKEEVGADEENDGEAGEEAGEGDEFDKEEDDGEEGEEGMGEGDVEDRVEDLESQLAELRAEFDALMGEEMQEPQHADLAGEFGGEEEPAFGGDEEEGMGGAGMPDFGGEEKVVGEVVAQMFEKSKKAKLEKAPEAKDKKKDKKVEEETQFLKKTPETSQKGVAKLAGTGNKSTLGAEQDKSTFTKVPPKPNYGGDSHNILGGGPLGGEYGKWKGDSAKDDTPSDNVDEKLKKEGTGGMDKTEGKFSGTGAKSQKGATFTQSPLTKAPHKLMPGKSK